MIQQFSHRRLNILTGEWILVAPHRTKRPWQGYREDESQKNSVGYDPSCYLCPGNTRANGEINPAYDSTYAFVNDFSALIHDVPVFEMDESSLLVAGTEKGMCRVVCFSPKHNLTLAEMETTGLENVITTWQTEYKVLGELPYINYVQIFENKGEIMGCSNPHPHGQIWAQQSIPVEPAKEQEHQLKYLAEKKTSMLMDYLQLELRQKERIIYENEGFALLVPFWALWPYETMILPKRNIRHILQLTRQEVSLFADIMRVTAVKYDNLFRISFPYSAGIHQAPTDGLQHEEWQMHMHFYPPLLRSATIKKFMVGYELLANPQRDITAETSASILRDLPLVHYSKL
ncbi:MAG TPA: UDP-glucose--hexose-1-phosphate uridylyltransferase [Bacteroidales bacterium]|nr:UDP-glucose--hexose-1-phosphate uridylyltransferase [Bacteroidales bacterium]